MSALSEEEIAETADEVPKKVCQYESGYGGRPCANEAVTAAFARTKSRVNDNGVHISTEVRIVWLCEDHRHVYPDVPPKEAEVTLRRIKQQPVSGQKTGVDNGE